MEEALTELALLSLRTQKLEKAQQATRSPGVQPPSSNSEEGNEQEKEEQNEDPIEETDTPSPSPPSSTSSSEIDDPLPLPSSSKSTSPSTSHSEAKPINTEVGKHKRTASVSLSTTSLNPFNPLVQNPQTLLEKVKEDLTIISLNYRLRHPASALRTWPFTQPKEVQKPQTQVEMGKEEEKEDVTAVSQSHDYKLRHPAPGTMA